LLPSEPKIFHGRERELSAIVLTFREETPRIAILGAAGMGKTSLARAVLHHSDITARYEQQRVFVACDSVSNSVQLASLIGAHLGLHPGKNLAQPVVRHFMGSPPCLLILDNLETVWESRESRGEAENLLSMLAGVKHLGLIVSLLM
jgi:predicted ATPase